jgi:taurine dioxygenase
VQEVPEVGGDTLFSDMVAAHTHLPDTIKEQIRNLVAVYDGSGLSPYVSESAQRMLARTYPPVEHPVVRTHPDTGEKILYVNSLLTSHIKDIPREVGEPLLRYLCAQAAVPEYQIRHRWRKNTVAFWDNRSTQHYASADYWPAIRKLSRISIGGDRPY